MNSGRCKLTVNLQTIRDNYKILQKTCNTSEVGAAVKADCYGLGMNKIVPILEEEGCRQFFVANKEEGAQLRSILKDQNLNIYVLNGVFEKDNKDITEYNLIPVLNSMEQVKYWTDKPCVIHFNTGMNRLGFHRDKVQELLNLKLNISCVMSHLSSAEEREDVANLEQLEIFKQISAFFPEAKKSLANSSGIFLGKEYHFDITRPGAALYGINPAPYLVDLHVQNPITLEAPIICVSDINHGEYVGYNRTFQSSGPTKIATLPFGYHDGYPRALSNKGLVFINGMEAKVVGRVSMDLVTIDVSHIPEKDLLPGQLVEVIGPNITPDKIANIAGTNTYEILTMLGNRYERVYI